MPNDATERLLNEIGLLIAEDKEYAPEGTLLYARLDTNMAGAAVFMNRGNHIQYHDDHGAFFEQLYELLFALWEAEDPAKRWAEMEYVVRDGKFEATYTYRDEIDPEKMKDQPFGRREEVVAKHFGDKPIVYPPWPGDDDTVWAL